MEVLISLLFGVGFIGFGLFQLQKKTLYIGSRFGGGTSGVPSAFFYYVIGIWILAGVMAIIGGVRAALGS